MDTPVLFKNGYPARHVKDEARIDIDYASRIFQITEVHDCSIAKIRMAGPTTSGFDTSWDTHSQISLSTANGNLSASLSL